MRGWAGPAGPLRAGLHVCWAGKVVLGQSFSGEVDNDLCWCRGEHFYFKATLIFRVY